MNENKPLLSIQALKTEFSLKTGRILRAVDGIDLVIRHGEIHGLVGESGCGKTVASLSILRLVTPPGIISGGEVLWNGCDLLKLRNQDVRKIRGKEIAMVFQNPQGALNPLYTIGEQMRAIVKLHRPMSKKDTHNEVIRLLKIVKLPEPEKRIDDYPHQLSGGMCQRVMIAMALSCRPQLLIADEPTASLDVTIQAQIMDLLLELREQFRMAILLISHDMAVVARLCDRISALLYQPQLGHLQGVGRHLHPSVEMGEATGVQCLIWVARSCSYQQDLPCYDDFRCLQQRVRLSSF